MVKKTKATGRNLQEELQHAYVELALARRQMEMALETIRQVVRAAEGNAALVDRVLALVESQLEQVPVPVDVKKLAS
jgi:hypothetical protein